MEMIPRRGKNVFYCLLHETYSLWDGTKFVEFKSGMVQTDDVGAAAIRRHPMFGRLFTEKAPPQQSPLHPELTMADLVVLPTDSYDCPECEETFTSKTALLLHHQETHEGKERSDERQSASSDEEVFGEGQGRGDAGRHGPRG